MEWWIGGTIGKSAKQKLIFNYQKYQEAACEAGSFSGSLLFGNHCKHSSLQFRQVYENSLHICLCDQEYTLPCKAILSGYYFPRAYVT